MILQLQIIDYRSYIYIYIHIHIYIYIYIYIHTSNTIQKNGFQQFGHTRSVFQFLLCCSFSQNHTKNNISLQPSFLQSRYIKPNDSTIIDYRLQIIYIYTYTYIYIYIYIYTHIRHNSTKWIPIVWTHQICFSIPLVLCILLEPYKK